MILTIGEILFDIYPDGKRFGGAPFNFAYHLKQFGLPVRFISRIGKDAEADEILSTLGGWGFGTEHIQIDTRHPTGRVLVSLDKKGVATFDFPKEMAYDYICLKEESGSSGEGIDLIYFGTLIQRTERGIQEVQKYLSTKTPSTPCFYDINLRPSCYRLDAIEKSLAHTTILKINADELAVLMELFRFKEKPEAFIDFLMKEFNLSLLALTKGEKGSIIQTPEERSEIGLNKNIRIADTVGAGDAFAAVTAFGFLKGWSAGRINRTASEFAAMICGIQGAIPQAKALYQQFSIC